MLKKPAKRARTKPHRSAAEILAATEAARLRRLRNAQRSITRLGRQLTQAVLRANIARIETARGMVEGTGWGVFADDHIRRHHQVELDLEARAVAAEEERDQLRQRLTIETVPSSAIGRPLPMPYEVKG